mgnify:CR=1 FL=1
MAQELADRRDVDFVLYEQLGLETILENDKFADLNKKTIDLIITQTLRIVGVVAVGAHELVRVAVGVGLAADHLEELPQRGGAGDRRVVERELLLGDGHLLVAAVELDDGVRVYLDRLARVRAAMAERDIDTMLLSVGHDLPYLRGRYHLCQPRRGRAVRNRT